MAIRRSSTLKSLLYFLHGLVFAFGSAVILYGSIINIRIFIRPTDVIFPTIFSVVVFTLFLLFAYLLTRNMEVAGLIASLLVLGFFYLWSVFIIVIIAALMAIISIGILFKRARYLDIHLVLTAISVAVVGYYCFLFVTLSIGTPWASLPVTIQPIDGLPDTIPPKTTAPDIYYIILDEYGRADMLQNVHGFDNSTFVHALEQRGFVVASQSQSNYPRTLLSLSSSLNMQYLDTMSAAMGGSDLWWPVKGTVQHSEVRRILENWGYQTVFFGNNWEYTDIRDGDFYQTPYWFELNTFNSLFWNQTSLNLLTDVDWLGVGDPSYDTHRRTILYDFETLPKVAALQGPKYVFVHVLAPHPPYVFDRNGNPLDPPYPYTIAAAESRDGYVEQLQFINKQVLAAIDGIFANSPTLPVIIVQGDHGPATLTDVESFKTSCLYERYSILNAYYLPGVTENTVPMDLSPVNSFRFIFNTYFRTDLELLPNRRYFSTNAHFYEFTEVTGQTEKACNLNYVATP